METILFYGTDQKYKEQAFEVRHNVFTLEQGYPSEIDIDEYDETAWHVVIIENNQPIATARLIKIGDKTKIGRVAVIQSARKRGLGAKVMQVLLDKAQELGRKKVVLHSQTHAQEFYEKLGFVSDGENFLEDGQPHIAMIRTFDNEK
ncbi:MAG: GNAT family N-acetyltransferase [Culicoidibacterales bacterium]